MAEFATVPGWRRKFFPSIILDLGGERCKIAIAATIAAMEGNFDEVETWKKAVGHYTGEDGSLQSREKGSIKLT